MSKGIKVNDDLYIINSKKAGNIEKIKQKIDKKLSRLYKNNKINIDNSYGISINYTPIENYLKENNSISGALIPVSDIEDYYVLELGLPDIEYSDWNILGSINLIEDTDDFILNSYTKKDLPKKYRLLEDPNTCEHCNQKRKRNQTFIIQNENTGEFLQVGSSCMEDYISPTELKTLVKLSDFIEQIKNDILREEDEIEIEAEYTNKIMFLGLMDFISTQREIKGTYENKIFGTYNDSKISEYALAYDLIFNERSLEVKMNLEKDYLSNIIPNENIYKIGLNVCNFYIHSLGDNGTLDFNDDINNIHRLCLSDIEFFSQGEIVELANAIKYKNIIESGSNKIELLLAKDVESAFIGGKEFVKSDVFDLKSSIEDYFVQYLLVNNQDFNSIENYSNYIFLDRDFDQFLLNKKKSERGELSGVEKVKYIDFISFVDSFKEEVSGDVEGFYSYIKEEKYGSYLEQYNNSRNLINSIKRDKRLENIRNLTSIGFLKNDYEKFKKKEEMKLNFNSGCFLADVKERIENIELKVLSKAVYEGKFGLKYSIWCEDINHNHICLKFTSNLPDEFSGDSFDEVKNKWVDISGTVNFIDVKNDFTTGFEKNVNYLNRVKILSKFKNNPEFSDIEFKSKGESLELFVKEKIVEDGELNTYIVESLYDNNKNYVLKTKQDLPKKLSGNFNIFGDNIYIKKINKGETNKLNL